jgi:two-component system, OmpR family, sensor histidine kinase TctE
VDIQDAVKTLQHLFVQLISLAKAERPKGETEESVQFDLVEAAASVARTFVTRALSARMELSFETSYDSLSVLGSPFFAGEMIANLLDNAIRYGVPGGHIVVRISEQLGILEIEDDGPGIPEEHRERVFERFYRLPYHTDREGSGLGLSIVQALGRRMNATVRLETQPQGVGLKVVVQFLVPEGATAEPIKAVIAASDEEIAP